MTSPREKQKYVPQRGHQRGLPRASPSGVTFVGSRMGGATRAKQGGSTSGVPQGKSPNGSHRVNTFGVPPQRWSPKGDPRGGTPRGLTKGRSHRIGPQETHRVGSPGATSGGSTKGGAPRGIRQVVSPRGRRRDGPPWEFLQMCFQVSPPMWSLRGSPKGRLPTGAVQRWSPNGTPKGGSTGVSNVWFPKAGSQSVVSQGLSPSGVPLVGAPGGVPQGVAQVGGPQRRSRLVSSKRGNPVVIPQVFVHKVGQQCGCPKGVLSKGGPPGAVLEIQSPRRFADGAPGGYNTAVLQRGPPSRILEGSQDRPPRGVKLVGYYNGGTPGGPRWLSPMFGPRGLSVG
jgi:hypothetical protein